MGSVDRVLGTACPSRGNSTLEIDAQIVFGVIGARGCHSSAARSTTSGRASSTSSGSACAARTTGNARGATGCSPCSRATRTAVDCA